MVKLCDTVKTLVYSDKFLLFSGVGKIYVSVDSMVYTIRDTLNAMADLKKGTKLKIYQVN